MGFFVQQNEDGRETRPAIREMLKGEGDLLQRYETLFPEATVTDESCLSFNSTAKL